MGGAVSAGRDNNDLVDNLVKSDYIKTELVERVFRAVDRADYFLPASRQIAYKDLAWKSGYLHISAPCIYSDVMEWLKLRSGLSFLNMGSGTGYLSTLAGLILGTGGVNHGIELNSTVVDYAIEKLENFISHSTAVDEFDFCFPKFVVGNCLCVSSNIQQYDRVYCGAACPKTYESNLKNMIKVGGILVMPIRGKLLQIKRMSDTEWVTKNIQHVSFASLVTPTPEHSSCSVTLADITPPSLQELCRSQIRNILRKIVYEEKPHIKYISRVKKQESSQPRENGHGMRRISLPIRDEESDSEEFDFSILHNLDRDAGSREMNALLSLVLNMRQDVVNDIFYEDRNEAEDSEDRNQSNQLTRNDNHEDVSESVNAENRSPSPSLHRQSSSCTENQRSAHGSLRDNDEIEDMVDDSNTSNTTTNRISSPESDTNSGNGETKRKHERKRHYSEGDEEAEESDESVPSEVESDVTSSPLQCDKVKKMKRRSPPPPNEWDLKRKQLSDCLKQKVNQLPLPISLKLYVNMNRHF